MEASFRPSPRYSWPIYAEPSWLNDGDPGYTREQIDYNGALKGKGLELAWVRDPVDLFFLHVQGSGRLRFPDGETSCVLYAGTNGHPYFAVGRELVERGYAAPEDMSMQKIREILSRDPRLIREILSLNRKYIFFRLAERGPFGASGALLTPMVSAAVDRNYIPMGAVMAVEADLPDPNNKSRALRGLILAQDTGTMQNKHVDLFCGAGEKAAYTAGRMRGRAKINILVSRAALGR